MFSLSALSTELLTDPTSLGYSACYAQSTHGNYYGDDNSLADLLNTKRYATVSDVVMTDVHLWMVEYDGDRRLQAHVSDPGPIGAIAQGTIRILTSPHVSTLMLTNPQIMALMSALTPTVFSAAEISAFVAMGAGSASRAEQLWGVHTTVTPNQIAQALGR